MALAEARAIWQRTANRCLVQEDAKRAPKLACCPPQHPAVKPAYFKSVGGGGGQDIPKTSFNLNPSRFNPFPTSTKWWLQIPPNYVHPEDAMDDQLNSPGAHSDTCPMHQCSANLARTRFSSWDLHDSKNSCEEQLRIEGGVGCEIPKKAQEFPGSSWIEAKEIPWWRSADANELALLVAQSHRSLDCIENCDLPIPQNLNVCCFCHGGTSTSFHHPNLGYAHYEFTAGNANQKHHIPNTEKPLRDTTTRHESNHEMEKDACKALLLEAICHSQTRAREAETASRQTYSEREYVIKLLLRQASQLFAYKLWLQLLQMETMHLQLNKGNSVSLCVALPVALPRTQLQTRKTRKSQHVSSSGSKQYYNPTSNVNRNAVVFAVGLGLVGAGFLLGWTAGWMLPAW